MNQPYVTVIIPAYNREKTIGRAIESVLSQTYTDFELLVVDDCSTDETVLKVQEYEKIDSRVRLISAPENMGASGARNLGIDEAAGKYIAFQDSDDVWLPEKLERQLDFMDDKLDFSYSSYKRIMLDGADGFIYPEIEPEKQIHSDGYYHAFMKDCHVSTQTIIVKTEALRETGGFDRSLISLEDAELAIRIARNYRVGYLGEVLAQVYATEGSISQNVGGYFQSKIMILDRHYDEMQREGVLNDVCSEIIGHAIRLGLLERVEPLLQKVLIAHAVK